MLTYLRHVTPTPLKVGAARALCTPWLGRAIAAVTRDAVPCRGVRIRTSASSVSPATKAAIFWGFYESSELRLLTRYLRADLDVVDLGASIGATGAHALRRLHPGRRYLGVEADPALRELLSRNLCRYSNVSLVTAAVDATPGAGPTTVLRRHGRTESSRVDPHEAVHGAGVTVARRTLSQVLRQQAVADYQLLCDIEGSEASLFANDQDAFRACQLMIVELHTTVLDGKPCSVAHQRELALSLGFRLIARDGAVHVFSR